MARHWAIETVGSALHRLMVALMFTMTTRKQVLGFELCDVTLNHDGALLFDRVGAALEMIRQYDPRRFRRMQREVAWIGVTNSPAAAGRYWLGPKAVVLDASFIRGFVVESIAMVIVHEATHARIRQRGVRVRGKEGREEHTCVGQEIIFARRIPGTEQLIQGAREKLESRYWERNVPLRST